VINSNAGFISHCLAAIHPLHTYRQQPHHRAAKLNGWLKKYPQHSE